MYRTGCCRSHHLTALLVGGGGGGAAGASVPLQGKSGTEGEKEPSPCTALQSTCGRATMLLNPTGVCQARPLLLQSETATLNGCSLPSPMSKAAPSRTSKPSSNKTCSFQRYTELPRESLEAAKPKQHSQEHLLLQAAKPHRSLSPFQKADAFNIQLRCRNIKLTC